MPLTNSPTGPPPTLARAGGLTCARAGPPPGTTRPRFETTGGAAGARGIARVHAKPASTPTAPIAWGDLAACDQKLSSALCVA